MKQEYPDGLIHENEIRKLSSVFSLSFQEIKEILQSYMNICNIVQEKWQTNK